jgi:hypothetical protein
MRKLRRVAKMNPEVGERLKEIDEIAVYEVWIIDKRSKVVENDRMIFGVNAWTKFQVASINKDASSLRLPVSAEPREINPSINVFAFNPQAIS